MAKVERAALAFVLALVVCASCDSSTAGGSGGETHWLDECGADADCGGGSLSCWCGVCTRGCRSDDECRVGARSATCFATASPGVVRRCGNDVGGGSSGVCLNVCNTSGDCPAGKDCIGGRCETAVQEAGTTMPPAEAGPPTPNNIAGKYTRVDAGVGFETEVTVPEPRLGITGSTGVDRLAGTWLEIEADGSPCRRDDIPSLFWSYWTSGVGLGWVACARLVIQADEQGVRGTISWQEADTGAAFPDLIPPPVGPFEAATDGARGYPENAEPARYQDLTLTTPNVPYRVLDGVFSQGKLSFWYSPYELWGDWCALQRSFPVRAGENSGYRCVPEGANQTSTDLGVLELCTTAMDIGLCSNGSCECMHRTVLCKSEAMCRCTASGCGPTWGGRRSLEIDVDLEKDVMLATRSGGFGSEQFVMQRVSR